MAAEGFNMAKEETVDGGNWMVPLARLKSKQQTLVPGKRLGETIPLGGKNFDSQMGEFCPLMG